jgi:hypothetical protein
MHDEVFTVDLGREFTGWSGTIGGKIVCIVPPTVFEDAAIQRTARALALRQGAQLPKCSCLDAQVGTIDAVA